MLKRQRPSSPISFPDEDTTGADLYEPDSKRRRYFAPQISTSQRKRDDTLSIDDDLEDVEAQENKRREKSGGKREWHVAAGAYKDANSLLHDLHAEQRHRTLFSQHTYTSPSADLSQAVYSSAHSFPRSASQSAKDFRNIPSDLSARLPHRHLSESRPLENGAQMICDGERQDEQAEANVVTQRYEDSNRLLRALFLSRRKEIGGQEQT